MNRSNIGSNVPGRGNGGGRGGEGDPPQEREAKIVESVSWRHLSIPPPCTPPNSRVLYIWEIFLLFWNLPYDFNQRKKNSTLGNSCTAFPPPPLAAAPRPPPPLTANMAECPTPSAGQWAEHRTGFLTQEETGCAVTAAEFCYFSWVAPFPSCFTPCIVQEWMVDKYGQWQACRGDDQEITFALRPSYANNNKSNHQ